MNQTPFIKSIGRFKTAKEQGQQCTHTRIGCSKLNILAGSYTINEKDEKEFKQNYINNIFKKSKNEFLTECQIRNDNAPILVDIDLRYSTAITERQHTDEEITSLIDLYTDEIKGLLNDNENIEFPVYIFHKPNVNKLEDKTKDGLHMKIGLKMNHSIQQILRNNVLKKIEEIWGHLPLNEEWGWDKVLDDGISKGHTNWQLLGSKKPSNEAYQLTHIYKASYVPDVDQFELIPFMFDQNYVFEHFDDFIARNPDHISYPFKPSVLDSIKKLRDKPIKRKPIIKPTISYDTIDYSTINNDSELDFAINSIIENSEKNNYEFKETHLYAMELPNTYYGPGSYDKWIRTGWALKNTDNKLFLTWVKLSSLSSEFSYTDIPDLYERWEDFEENNEDGLTNRSILYWVKNDNPTGYSKVKRESVDYFINASFAGATEFDIAQVLFKLFKDQYTCTSIKNNIWFKYENHRWVPNESGTSLRKAISTTLHSIYQDYSYKIMGILQTYNEGEEKWNELTKKSNKCGEIGLMCKKTDKKNNIMKEAQALFYDPKFEEKLDSNPYLLCCNNGVIDFKENCFRNGLPDDYLSMCTRIDYVPLRKCDTTSKSEIEEFMNQLFPIKELCRYMWDHLAACLLGTNENQTFNIYTGSGRNGKSKLTDLMAKMLGDYVGSVPITLVTRQRNVIGSVSPEIAQLKGKRYAIMQEPTKGDVLNEGVMKQITGGDRLDARGLYKDAISFIPQFDLVTCSNTLFEINSNDDGTWRRIRKCDFKSYFSENPVEGDPDRPYQFKIDKQLDKKFSKWKVVMLSMLTDLSFKNKGIVIDCDTVLEASNQYRESKDYLANFIKDKIIVEQGRGIKQTELQETFKIWYAGVYDKNIPKGRELIDYMDKKYKKRIKSKWMNVRINYENDDDDDESECE
jgi:P4 family phage/plasmid primase-like protien